MRTTLVAAPGVKTQEKVTLVENCAGETRNVFAVVRAVTVIDAVCASVGAVTEITPVEELIDIVPGRPTAVKLQHVIRPSRVLKAYVGVNDTGVPTVLVCAPGVARLMAVPAKDTEIDPGLPLTPFESFPPPAPAAPPPVRLNDGKAPRAVVPQDEPLPPPPDPGELDP